MGKSHAYRNLKLCSKDCLCLFVCPTGATNNETGQIDFDKCIGCGACAAACPAKAITMIPNVMPKQQPKNPSVINQIFKVVDSKIDEIKILNHLLKENKEDGRLIKTLIHSNKVMIEDLLREAGYMLPQSQNTHEFLKLIKETGGSSAHIAQELLDKIKVNE